MEDGNNGATPKQISGRAPSVSVCFSVFLFGFGKAGRVLGCAASAAHLFKTVTQFYGHFLFE